MASLSSAITGHAADDKLAELGLTAFELQDAALVGYTAAAGCTDHDPRSLPGTLAWGKGTGHLRDALKLKGWTPDSSSNYETVVHPSGDHAVALAAGTLETGKDDRKSTPRTKTPKGPATSRAVRRNVQLSLALVAEAEFQEAGWAEDGRGPQFETWLLLHYYDRDAGKIRLELSFPAAMEGKQITRWSERIILPPVPFSDNVEIDIEDEHDDTIEIDVRQKSD